MILNSSATAKCNQIIKQMRYGERKAREKRQRFLRVRKVGGERKSLQRLGVSHCS